MRHYGIEEEKERPIEERKQSRNERIVTYPKLLHPRRNEDNDKYLTSEM